MLNYINFIGFKLKPVLKRVLKKGVLTLLLALSVQLSAKEVLNKKIIDATLDTIVNDTSKIKYLRYVIKSLEEEDSELAFKCIEEAKSLADKVNDPYWQIKVLKTEATLHFYNDDFDKSAKTFLKAFKLAQTNGLNESQMEVLYEQISLNVGRGPLEKVVPMSKYLHPILKKLKSREEEATYLSDIGRDYYAIGNYPEAMQYYISSQEVFEKNHIETVNYGRLLHNIGSVFKRQDNQQKALEFYEQELALGRKLKSEKVIAEGLYLAAGMYSELGDTKKGRKYNEESLAIYEKLGDKSMIALLTGNMADDYEQDGNYDMAIQSLQKALNIYLELKEYNKIAWIQKSLASYYSKSGKYAKALEYIKSAEKNAEKTTRKQLLRKSEIAKTLAHIYYRHGDYKNAYDTYMTYLDLEDSLSNNEKLKLVGELDAKYETEKKEAEIALLNKDKELKSNELRRKEAEVNEQKTMRNGMFVIIALIAIVAVIIYRGYRINKKNNYLLSKQNDEINYKNLIIEEKNKNITDSIEYARRIQTAILPPASLLNEYLKNGFIYYEPKDVVAGDFYWLEKSSNKVLFAAADCTGHGVPGAMISVVCHNALNRAVREFGLTDPAIILNKVRDLVIETFEKSTENVQDGMDIALCVLDKEKNELEYAGANNSLYIVREEELIEIKPDKQPISKYIENKPFTRHQFKLKKGDTIYSFTDGFADQFGGEKGKKFKYKAFKELLLSMRHETMDNQFRIIKDTFHTWRGELEQIDDVCVLGVRV